jgi:hypothetical protein
MYLREIPSAVAQQTLKPGRPAGFPTIQPQTGVRWGHLNETV